MTLIHLWINSTKQAVGPVFKRAFFLLKKKEASGRKKTQFSRLMKITAGSFHPIFYVIKDVSIVINNCQGFREKQKKIKNLGL